MGQPTLIYVFLTEKKKIYINNYHLQGLEKKTDD